MAKFLAIAVLPWLLVLPLQACSPAQAQAGLDSRVSRLETELLGIQNRLNQIEASRSRQGVAVPAPVLPSGDRRGDRRIVSADPQFDRLATLVIELKERVTALETRLNR
ncbi:hypothetical protein C7B65_03420 [Phormidesmis priestleyi ULC007]|uniref:Uncharacterized protein n=1 Tax=Phormidesmis priestleyi ULC007 TaxID=1920490 RepID=A0A2T1DMJ7_9CYAN|nr:hypothetical protein [Phormidesmis priestleyi]PSB21644.1 hypothetical protein C7B65_03420 [Phormidesmis priestleyi ULC007]PZO54685.1 MAG: hypothetical protein DCF14_01940 [Phormidesmis priestleyi]